MTNISDMAVSAVFDALPYNRRNMTVFDLVNRTGYSRSTIGNALRVLRTSGLPVVREQVGYDHFYFLTDDRVIAGIYEANTSRHTLTRAETLCGFDNGATKRLGLRSRMVTAQTPMPLAIEAVADNAA